MFLNHRRLNNAAHATAVVRPMMRPMMRPLLSTCGTPDDRCTTPVPAARCAHALSIPAGRSGHWPAITNNIARGIWAIITRRLKLNCSNSSEL